MTFLPLKLYPFDTFQIVCMKCDREERIDINELIDRFGLECCINTAEKQLAQDWLCDDPYAMPAYRQHPRVMYCRPTLPEWHQRSSQYWKDVNCGRTPKPVHAKPPRTRPNAKA